MPKALLVTLAVGVVFGLVAAPGCAQAPAAYVVEVSATDRGYPEMPLTARVPAPDRPAAAATITVADQETKQESPCTARSVADGLEVTWIARALAQGQTRRYRIAFGREARRDAGEGVQVDEPEEAGAPIEVSVGGQLFTRYCYQGAPKPYCYPVIGPTGAPVTRAYPMEEVEGESRDHPHQRSWWCTHGEVNGLDFWTESDTKGRQVHREFEAVESGQAYGLIRAVNDWVTPEGEKVCEDMRELRIYNLPDVRLADFTIEIRATEGPVEFGDTKEGMFGFRLTTTMQLRGGEGHITNSEGQTDGQTWGKSAAWCDYAGPVEGETVGIAVFDHPSSFRHPTYWHVRDYGLFAANPFGLRHFINDRTGAGRYTLERGETLTFRYRVLIHRGTCEEAQVADWYAAYAEPPNVELVSER